MRGRYTTTRPLRPLRRYSLSLRHDSYGLALLRAPQLTKRIEYKPLRRPNFRRVSPFVRNRLSSEWPTLFNALHFSHFARGFCHRLRYAIERTPLWSRIDVDHLIQALISTRPVSTARSVPTMTKSWRMRWPTLRI